MRNAYPYHLEADETGALIVSFPDVPEALTSGTDATDAAGQAADCLRVALAGLMKMRRPVPEPSAPQPGQPTVILPALTMAKLALYRGMRETKTSNVALAKRLGVTETVVRRLVDFDRDSQISKLEAALEAIGYRMTLDVGPV